MLSIIVCWFCESAPFSISVGRDTQSSVSTSTSQCAFSQLRTNFRTQVRVLSDIQRSLAAVKVFIFTTAHAIKIHFGSKSEDDEGDR